MILSSVSAGKSSSGDISTTNVPFKDIFVKSLRSALAAIVIAAMLHLSKPGYLRDLLARAPREFAVAAIVVAGELTLGVLHGIALGVALSLLMLIYRTSHPQGAVVGQLPGTEAYRDVKRHPEALTFPGLLIWRAGGELFFASIGHLDEGLKAALAANRPPAKHVLLDGGFGELRPVIRMEAPLQFFKSRRPPRRIETQNAKGFLGKVGMFAGRGDRCPTARVHSGFALPIDKLRFAAGFLPRACAR